MSRLHVHWGLGVMASYLLFASGTIGFVAFAMSVPVDLVSADYYERSLRQDVRAEATRNADALGTGVAIALDDDRDVLRLSLPAAHAATATGVVTWYRPSNSRADLVVPLQLSPAGSQDLPTRALARGHWIVQLAWDAEGRSFYREAAVRLP